MTTRHLLALIPGDGIGREVIPAGVAVLEAAGRRHGIEFAWKECDWSCDRYVKTGSMMPDDSLEQIRPPTPSSSARWGTRACPITSRSRACSFSCAALRPVRVRAAA